MKKINLFFVVLLFSAIIALFSWQGCQMEDLTGSSPVNTNPDLSFLAKDSVSGDVLAGDSAFVNQMLLMIGTTTLNNVVHWQYTWGDNSSPDTGRIAIHKYYTSGNYQICLKVYDANWTVLQTTCKTLRIVTNTGYNAFPVFKKISSTNSGGNNWSVTYGLSKKVIQCGITQPFIVFAEISGWNPIYLNPGDTTADGYYRYTEIVQNNTIRKFSYGGNFGANCYASIAPNLPYWSSEFYISSEQKICVKWIDGNPMPITTTGGELPGMVGDVGLAPVVRFGLSNNGNSVDFYFSKNQMNGNPTAPFWVHTLNGINNPLTLLNTPNYANWWMYSVDRSLFPQNFTDQFKYGNNFGVNVEWANMSGSGFWNNQYGALEININQLGGDIIIQYNGQKFVLSPNK